MIVIGVDVHKHSLSAVAVDEVGRQLDASETADGEELVSWSKRVGRRRLWALEDCRHVTRGFERALQRHRQRLVRVPPRLTAPERRRGRVRGKSDLIDALAIARAALREPRLDSPRPEEARLPELKLLVDHRDDLVDERRRAQQRLRWHLHELDPTLRAPRGALDRSIWLDRLSRQLARREQTIQVRIARELVGRCRNLTRSVTELDRELHLQATAIAPRLLELPGCAALTAAKLLCEIGPIDRFRSDAQLARHAGVAPLDASSGKHQRHRLDRGDNRQLNCALHRIAVTQIRLDGLGSAYYQRRRSEGDTSMEALRALKRRLARIVFNLLRPTDTAAPACMPAAA